MLGQQLEPHLANAADSVVGRLQNQADQRIDSSSFHSDLAAVADTVDRRIAQTAVRLERLAVAETVQTAAHLLAAFDSAVVQAIEQTGQTFVAARLLAERDLVVLRLDELVKNRNRPEMPLTVPVWEMESSRNWLRKGAVLELE